MSIIGNPIILGGGGGGEIVLSSIAAVFRPEGDRFYEDENVLDDLKPDLTVTATFSNGATLVLSSNDYTLSGSMTEGRQTITVIYQGKTTTFEVQIYVRSGCPDEPTGCYYKIDGTTCYVRGTPATGYTERPYSRWETQMINGWASNTTITTLVYEEPIAWTTYAAWCYGCSNLTTILNQDNFYTDYCTTFYQMFQNCPKLMGVDFSTWNTSNVTSLSWTFATTRMPTYDLSAWDVSNVTMMEGTFNQAGSAQATINCHGWDTSSVTSLRNFIGGSNVLNLIVDTFDTSHVTNWNYAFNGCWHIVTMDLSSFDFGATQNNQVAGMFNNNHSLAHIYVKQGHGFPASSGVANVFGSSTNLPGYNASKTDASMGKFVSEGGYFELKPST